MEGYSNKERRVAMKNNIRARDLLRSDHAPFWREGIPGLMVTDTANFRYPFYHTQADTIDKLDFNFMTKACKATIATAIDYAR